LQVESLRACVEWNAKAVVRVERMDPSTRHAPPPMWMFTELSLPLICLGAAGPPIGNEINGNVQRRTDKEMNYGSRVMRSSLLF
jgi:hypothetical protein